MPAMNRVAACLGPRGSVCAQMRANSRNASPHVFWPGASVAAPEPSRAASSAVSRLANARASVDSGLVGSGMSPHHRPHDGAHVGAGCALDDGEAHGAVACCLGTACGLLVGCHPRRLIAQASLITSATARNIFGMALGLLLWGAFVEHHRLVGLSLDSNCSMALPSGLMVSANPAMRGCAGNSSASSTNFITLDNSERSDALAV